MHFGQHLLAACPAAHTSDITLRCSSPTYLPAKDQPICDRQRSETTPQARKNPKDTSSLRHNDVTVAEHVILYGRHMMQDKTKLGSGGKDVGNLHLE